MVLLWGLIGIISAIALPGWLLMRHLKQVLPHGLHWALIFGISLAFNQVLVLLLASIGFYTVFCLRIIIGVEIFLCLYALRGSFFKKINFSFQKPKISAFSFLLTLFILFQLIYILLAFNQIFVNSDAVLSWNKWAMDWAHFQQPVHSENYPQLLPIIFSMPYVVMGSHLDLQFFTKPISELFILSMILAGLGFAEIRKNKAIAWGVLFAGIGLALNYSYYLGNGSGYADIPSACLAFIAWITALSALNGRRINYTLLALSSILAGASAATKQAGIFYAVFHPFFIYFAARSHRHKISIKTLMMQYCWSGLIFLPYTCYNQYQILVNHMPVETGRLEYAKSLAAQGRTGFNLFLHILFSIKWSWLCAWILALIAACFDTEALIVLPLIVSYFIIWFIAFNYDTRNLALITPFIFFYATKWLASYWVKQPEMTAQKSSFTLSFRPVIVALVAVGMTILVGESILTPQKMVNHQINLQKKLMGKKPALNEMLYSYFGDPPRQATILTNWYFLPLLPEFAPLYKAIDLSSSDTLLQGIKNKTGSYLLITLDSDFHPPADTESEINVLVQEKRLLISAQSGHQYLYQIQPLK